METDSENTDFQFYPGACGKLDNAYEVEDYRFLKQYKELKLAPKKKYQSNKKVTYDYALLKLTEPVKSSYLKLGLLF